LSKLRAKIMVIPDGGHFSLTDNCFALSEVVDEVLNMSDNRN